MIAASNSHEAQCLAKYFMVGSLCWFAIVDLTLDFNLNFKLLEHSMETAAKTTFAFQKDDIRKNLPAAMQNID